MHEQRLAAALVSRAIEVAEASGESRVMSLLIRVGGLSHVTREAITVGISEAAYGTPVEGARIEVAVGEEDVTDPAALDVVLVAVEVGGDV